MNRLGADQLVTQGHDLILPVTVGIAVSDPAEPVAEEIVLSRLLRLMPGKRMVCMTEWQGKPAVAKLFFHPRHWQRHLTRELEGARLLERAGIPAAERLYDGHLADGRGGVLVSRFLPGENLQAFIDNDVGPDDAALRSVLGLIAQCHGQGLWQADIHPGNFLLHQGRCYLLDPAAVRVEAQGEPLSSERSRANLALFFAQFPAQFDAQLDDWIALYHNQSRSQSRGDAREDFSTRVRQARQARLDNYERKLFRSTSEIQKRQSRRRRLLVRRSISGNGSLAFAYSPDSFIDAGEVIKAGNTTTVARVRLDGRDCLVKRYNIKNFLHGLKRLVTPSRASKSWRAGLILEMLGVETARPLLALECRSLWLLRRESYILCEFVAGPTVWELLGRDDVDDEAAEKVFRGFQRLLDTMRQYRISHGDMKATNFIFRGDRLVVVDLDAMARHASVASFRPAFRKDLDRFRKNFSGDSPLHRFASRAERLVGEFHD